MEDSGDDEDEDGAEDEEEESEAINDPTKIPDDTHFFFILTKEALYSLSHYSNSIAKTVKSI